LLTVIGLIPDPDSFQEGERAGRCLLASDRMLSQLYEAPQSQARAGTRPANSPASPMTHGRKRRDGQQREKPNWRLEFIAKTDRRMARFASDCGIWPDGTPFDPATPAPENPWLMPDSLTIFQCGDPLQIDRWPALLMVNRINAVIRALARKDGCWPDYSPFGKDDPDYYSLSPSFDEQVMDHPPPLKAAPWRMPTSPHVPYCGPPI